MAWYFQTSPHDMHDYDSAQTPILVDGPFNGKMRKMVLTAARNGYFFTIDRVTGEHLLTAKYGQYTNWAKGLNKYGGPEHDPVKDPTIGGAIVSPTSDGTVNWQPPAYSPDTGLFYVPEGNGFSLFYLTDVDPRGSMGLGGKEEVGVGSPGNYLSAIDYKTGMILFTRRPLLLRACRRAGGRDVVGLGARAAAPEELRRGLHVDAARRLVLLPAPRMQFLRLARK